MGRLQEIDFDGSSRAHRVLSRIMGGKPWPPAFFNPEGCYNCCDAPDDPCNSANCTFFDGTMIGIVNSTITSRLNGTTAVNSFTSTRSQDTGRGNDPPSYSVQTSLSSAANQNGELFAVQMETWSWNPASQGGITGLRYCIDEYLDEDSGYSTNPSGSQAFSVDCWFVVKQAGKTYGVSAGGIAGTGAGNWTRRSLNGLTSADFSEFYSGERPAGPAVGLVNTTSHPDFSQAGAPITFGWAVHPSGTNANSEACTSTTLSFWDNLCVTVTHDNVIVNPNTNCKPTGCDRFSSDYSNIFDTRVLRWFGPASSGNVTSSVTADSANGNNAPCTKVSVSAPLTGSIYAVDQVWKFLLHNDTISPADACGINTVSVCFDSYYKTRTTSGAGDGTMAAVFLACRQNNKLYVAISSLFTPSQGGFGSHNVSLNQNAFTELYPTGPKVGGRDDNPSSHPDFSSGGSEIEFGVVVRSPTNAQVTEMLIDNICVKVTTGFAQCLTCEGDGSLDCTDEIFVHFTGNLFDETGADQCQWVRQSVNQVLSNGVVLTWYAPGSRWLFNITEENAPDDTYGLQVQLFCNEPSFADPANLPQAVLNVSVQQHLGPFFLGTILDYGFRSPPCSGAKASWNVYKWTGGDPCLMNNRSSNGTIATIEVL